MSARNAGKSRHLVVVFGDQLTVGSAALDGFKVDADAVLMMEVEEEASYVPQHKQRLVLFFSAMRHFRDRLRDQGMVVHYAALDDHLTRNTLGEELARWVHKTRPERLICTKPGDWRVEETLRRAARDLDCRLDVRDDRHFLCDSESFAAFAGETKSLLLERFYRRMRRQCGILMDGDAPLGERWNFDAQNRDSFGQQGPGEVKRPRSFEPDNITTAVIGMVERRFANSPGRLERFGYPVTEEQAQAGLADFVDARLANFGRYQDAMASGHPFLYHSRLSCVLNLHLLDPRAAIAAATEAYHRGEAPLNAVEGFVRQILGWREYIRGIYWLEMPQYAALNALQAKLPMPAFMWTAETDMNCIRESVAQLIDYAYAHHIQRLMVLGLFALLLGVRPLDVHRWHLSMYADAIDWVSLPNVLGMSQYADGGIVGSKPYAASGNYINRMSDYCRGCRYDPKKAVGENACPFTTLYWDFLARHRDKLATNRRMGLQLRNLDRKSKSELGAIRKQADAVKQAATTRTYL